MEARTLSDMKDCPQNSTRMIHSSNQYIQYKSVDGPMIHKNKILLVHPNILLATMSQSWANNIVLYVTGNAALAGLD
jgi:hypothetical protein